MASHTPDQPLAPELDAIAAAAAERLRARCSDDPPTVDQHGQRVAEAASAAITPAALTSYGGTFVKGLTPEAHPGTVGFTVGRGAAGWPGARRAVRLLYAVQLPQDRISS